MDVFWILLLLLAAAGGVAVWMRRATTAPPPPRLEASDELRALGLTPARPRSAEPVDGARPALPRPEPVRVHDAPPAEPQAVLRDGAWDHAAVVAPLLTAFATAVGGPVAVLSVRDGVASVDALAEADAAPRLPQRRLSAASTADLRDATTESFSTSAAAADALLAFRSAGIPAPEQAAACRLSGAHLVVAGGPLGDRALALADRFADLLDDLLAPRDASPEADAADAERADADDRDGAPADGARADDALDAAPLDGEAPGAEPARQERPVRPDDVAAPREPAARASTSAARPVAGRRETKPMSRTALLSAEIASSREADQPLAFALVTRADVESALASGDPEAATNALCAELRTHEAVRRAEPFGDLVVGVFLDADALAASRWTRTLIGHEPPLRLGLVAPADYDAAAVRADAESALAEAWAEGELVVVSG